MRIEPRFDMVHLVSVPRWLVQVVHWRDPRARDATFASLAERTRGRSLCTHLGKPWHCVSGSSPSSIPPEATRRHDGDQCVQIEISDCL
jgi:hypothetical protein